MNTRLTPASAFVIAARSSSSATAVLALGPSTSFALSALRTTQTGISPRPSSSLTTARPVFPVAPTTAYIRILHGARGAPYDIPHPTTGSMLARRTDGPRRGQRVRLFLEFTGCDHARENHRNLSRRDLCDRRPGARRRACRACAGGHQSRRHAERRGRPNS